ncbi:MAG: cobalamin-binding protein [Nitrospira sp.]|nr:MAG: cobalamin-binding protein [Nitrospira sp.]
MSCGCNPQGLLRPWGFFYLGSGFFRTGRCVGFLLGAGVLLAMWPAPATPDDEMSTMKRRRQGILTGMPFMANITPRTFVDALGRKLFLAKAPSRVVSMAPNVTEMLFALGLEAKVVAVTPFCDYPPEAQRKTHLGGTNPSIEQILALKPDLVLAPQDFIQPDLLQNLDRLKVPTFVLQAAQLEDVLAQIQTVARMFDRSKAGDELAGTIRQRIAAVRERTQSLAHPRVLYVLNTDPLQTVGPGSFIHQLIEAAGGANIAAGTSTAYPRFALEEVLARDPELIIFPVGTAEGISEEDQQQWRRWPSLSAVKHNRLVLVPSVLVDRPGPRIVEGLELLAQAIHPEAFTKDSQEEQP